MKNTIVIFIVLILISLGLYEAKAQSYKRDFQIDYRLDSISIDKSYMDNEEMLREFSDFLNYLSHFDEVTIDSINFEGTASPDGYIERNQWLSRNRMEMFKKWMREEMNFPDSLIMQTDSYIPWQRFREGVAASDIPYREEVLKILDMPADTVKWYRGMHTDSRLLRLRLLDQGRAWETLKPILAKNRFALASLIYHFDFPSPSFPSTEIIGNPPQITFPNLLFFPGLERWVGRLYLKTNLIEWALAIANLAVEVDMAKHWSFALPISYSRWDYFTPKTKFRVAGIQPEVRYWFSSKSNDGWFLGAHFGASYYNMAFGGKERYQDYEGKTPAVGGGLAFGWRKQFGAGNRWRFEFSLGAGCYSLHYNVFENTPNYKDGALIDTRRKTYIGLDRASLSIGYAFDLWTIVKQKGGKR